MAEVPVSVQRPTAAGLKPTNTGSLSTSNTYLVPNDGKTVLRVNNKSGEATKVTIKTPNTVGGNAIADKEVEVIAGEERIIGPFERDTYNNVDGNLEVTFSKITEVTVAALKTGL